MLENCCEICSKNDGNDNAIRPRKSSAVIDRSPYGFNYIEKHASTPSVEDLAKYRLSELNTDYGARIKEDWKTYVRDA